MKFLLISPYHGGSHRAWACGYRQHSAHEVALLTLPARFWKWRMHGGAVTLARRFLDGDWAPQLILATDMLDLTTFLALTRHRTSHVPAVLYLHENQLTYPLPADGTTGPMRRQLGERDMHYAFVNYASALVADLVLFNSHFHREAFLEALPPFLKHFPEYNELDSVDRLRAKSQVLPVGIDLKRLEHGVGETAAADSQPPLILWNQRWEYDKNPADFFQALYVLAEEGIPFRLALCGQQFGRRPVEFDEAASRLSSQLVFSGYADDADYRRLLWEAVVTASTAHHEFFGISVLEAIYCHTFPILPNRLSYPELLPESFHGRCLYQDQAGLIERLRWAVTHPQEARAQAAGLAGSIARFDWTHLAPRYDRALAALAA